MKPKQSAIFELSNFENTEFKTTNHRGVKYVHLACEVIELDGERLNNVHNYIQLSLKRDYFYLYLFLKKNELFKTKARIRMNILSDRRTTYSLIKPKM